MLSMNAHKKLVRLLQAATMLCILFSATATSAFETAISEDNLSIVDYLTDKDGKYTGPTVEQNVLSMDTDKNGFADVTEVRAFLALKHGKDYQKAVLDRWEVRSLGGGCPIPFAKEFVSESSQ
jgi:gamma-glutamylcysteine synthetase